MSDGGKGSRPRPLSVTHQEYSDRWNMIFQKDQPEDKVTRNNQETQEALQWTFTGLAPHNGEHWYKCRKCGHEDWIPSYGTIDQLKCKC